MGNIYHYIYIILHFIYIYLYIIRVGGVMSQFTRVTTMVTTTSELNCTTKSTRQTVKFRSCFTSPFLTCNYQSPIGICLGKITATVLLNNVEYRVPHKSIIIHHKVIPWAPMGHTCRWYCSWWVAPAAKAGSFFDGVTVLHSYVTVGVDHIPVIFGDRPPVRQ